MRPHVLVQQTRLAIRREQIDYRIEQIILYWLKRYIQWLEKQGHQQSVPLTQTHMMAYLHRIVWNGEEAERFKQAAFALSFVSEIGSSNKKDNLIQKFSDPSVIQDRWLVN
jgi:hypothetical protein